MRGQRNKQTNTLIVYLLSSRSRKTNECYKKTELRISMNVNCNLIILCLHGLNKVRQGSGREQGNRRQQTLPRSGPAHTSRCRAAPVESLEVFDYRLTLFSRRLWPLSANRTSSVKLYCSSTREGAHGAMIGRRTCDQEVPSSMAGQGAAA